MSQASPGKGPAPLLPTLTDPSLNAQLRRSLEVLRNNCPDEQLRKRLEGVLAGTHSLRDLADSSVFESFVTPLTQRGLEQFERMESELGGLEGLARRTEPGDENEPRDRPSDPPDGPDDRHQSPGTW